MFTEKKPVRSLKTGWAVRAMFSLELHRKDLALLKSIQGFFNGVGNISLGKTRETANYRVSSIKDLKVIIEHLEKYPLLTQKRADFLLFKQGIEMISRKEHLTIDGLNKIVAIKASINKGLSDTLKAEFPDITSSPRPTVEIPESIDPNWISGFSEGEGCFYISIFESKTIKSGLQVQLSYIITQHTRDSELMKSLIRHLNCGRSQGPISPTEGKCVKFIVTKIAEINNNIIPFFDKYPLHGVKKLDYVDFKRAATILENKGHLTIDGLEELRQIKARMNTGRS